jgi:anti-sigma regulatory factor (Ser/Thr protein kinase)
MTMPLGEARATFVVPTREDPPSEVVRAWIDTALSDVPITAHLPAVVLTHELLANAYRHARAPYVLRFVARPDRRTLRVLVDDCGPGTGPCGTAEAELVLIAGLSRRWGVERRHRGRTIWAEVGLDG